MTILEKFASMKAANRTTVEPTAALPKSDVQTALAYLVANLQPLDAELSAIAGLVSAANKVPYFTGSGTADLADFTAFGRSLVDDANAAAALTTLGVSAFAQTILDDADASTALSTLGVSTFIKTLIDDTDATTARATLGLVIGTNVQAYDAELAAIAGLTSAADSIPYFTGSGTAALATFTTAGRALVDDADAAAQRTTLGIAIGTNVQAYDATLTSIAALGTAADKLAYTTGVDTWAETAFTSFGRSLVDDADAATAQATLGLVIGTNVQAYDVELAAIAGLTSAADSAPYFTGSGTAALMTVTAAARTILDDTTVAAIATTLGLGTASNPQFATIELGAASDTTLSRSAAGELAVEGVVVKKVGKETIWIPSQAMVARSTNGAAPGTVETTTNKNIYKTFDFDTTTQEFVQFFVKMPKSWNESTVTAAFTWSHAATTTNFGVVWALEAVAFSDADAGDAAVGTAQQIADTGGTTNTIYVTGATPAITIAGSPAAEDWVLFQVKRVPSDGSDTMAIDARLHGVTLYITTDASTDA